MLFGDYIGFIILFVLEKIMELIGVYFFIIFIIMVFMLIGFGEVMVVLFIIVYDIYRVYINFFRYLVLFFGGNGGMEKLFMLYM